MNRLWTSLLSYFLFAAVCRTVAQVPPQSDQQTPEDAFGTRELIAWSSLQKPQPAPQPLPPRDTPVPQPDQQSDQQAKSPSDPHTQESPAQSFTGKIVKEGAEYQLRAASSTIYQLAEAGDLRRYEGQEVRVTGNLEPGTNRIHVHKVELLS